MGLHDLSIANSEWHTWHASWPWPPPHFFSLQFSSHAHSVISAWQNQTWTPVIYWRTFTNSIPTMLHLTCTVCWVPLLYLKMAIASIVWHLCLVGFFPFLLHSHLWKATCRDPEHPLFVCVPVMSEAMERCLLCLEDSSMHSPLERWFFCLFLFCLHGISPPPKVKHHYMYFEVSGSKLDKHLEELYCWLIY